MLLNYRPALSLMLGTFMFSFCKAQNTVEKTSVADTANTRLDFTAKQSYDRPKPFGFVTSLPSDLWQVTKTPFRKENLKWDAAVVGTTALLIIFDQKITDNVNDVLHKASISSNLDYGNGFSIQSGQTNIKIIKKPRTAGALFYSLGEGWVGVAIGAGFWVEGMINHNNRSRQTASDLMEGFLSSGISSQIIKRITGRESPFVATAPGGVWRPFPSFSEFQNNTEHYDAFPSGHLTTMMTTVSILAENYPECKWIRPIGYSLISLTGLAMVHGKVHWAGDYPLAIAIGYLNGKIITGRHKKPTRHPKKVWDL